MTAQFLRDVSAMLGVLAGIAVSAGILLHRRSPLGKLARWLTRRNLVEPAGQWARHQVVTAMRPEIERLDGRITTLSDHNDEQHADTANCIAEIRAALVRDPNLRTRSDDPEDTA